jgi:hypothetical protein
LLPFEWESSFVKLSAGKKGSMGRDLNFIITIAGSKQNAE